MDRKCTGWNGQTKIHQKFKNPHVYMSVNWVNYLI